MITSFGHTGSGRWRRRGGTGAGRTEGPGAEVDVTPPLLRADPYQGGMQAVAEAGATSQAVAATTGDYGQSQFRQSGAAGDHGPVRGCLKASRKPAARSTSPSCPARLALPTKPTAAAPATPRSAASGCSTIQIATLAFKARMRRPADRRNQAGSGQSCTRDICGAKRGAAAVISPPTSATGDLVRLNDPRRHGESAHMFPTRTPDALAEMAMAAGIGARCWLRRRDRPHAYWFGEGQARYIVTVPAAESGRVLAR